MNILITGGTGFIGRYLICHLIKTRPEIKKIIVVSRSPKKAYKIFAKFIDIVTFVDNFGEISAVEKFDAIINLAGEGIANKKWSKKQKNILLESRLKMIEKISELCVRLRMKPEIIISASAVGFYGSHDDEVLDEESASNEIDFAHELCAEIESEISKIQYEQTRICIARFGIVLGKDGGALQKMLPAFKYGLGGKIASGKQFMSWIHIHDLIYAVDFLLKNKELTGAFNLTAPKAVTNQEFSKTLAKTLHRPALFNMPLWLVHILFGEMGDSLLANGQNVYPKRLIEAGFKFKYNEIKAALTSFKF
jgi:uncharacterized protein (TIGR01777 family)